MLNARGRRSAGFTVPPGPTEEIRLYVRNNVSRLLNDFLPPPIAGRIAARRTLRRHRHGVRIEREMEILPFLLGEGDWAFDVGANVGDYTLSLAKLVGPNGRVFSFEPNPNNFNKLSHLVQMGRLEHVSVHPIALGETSGTASLVVERDQSMWRVNSGYLVFDTEHFNRFTGRTRRSTVRIATLDELFPNCSMVSFMKVDVEGFELPVLRGARELLRASHPHLLIEVSGGQADYGYGASELVDFLTELDYQPLLYWRPQDGDEHPKGLRYIDAQGLAKHRGGAGGNCLFVADRQVETLMDRVNEWIQQRKTQ